MTKVTITTDGGCSPNPGVGAWAAILRSGNHVKTMSGADPQTTNNRMELTAIIEALECLKKPCAVTLRTDSMLCIYAIRAAHKPKARRRYEKKGKNMDLVSRLWIACLPHHIELTWVKGHAGDADNEAVDSLCTAAMRKA